MIENALGYFLLNGASTQPLIALRVFPLQAPQGTSQPTLVYNRITSPREHSMEGSAGFVEALFQIDCLAKTYKAALQLAEAVRLDLDGFRGQAGQSPDVTDIDGVFLDDERDTYNDELQCYCRQLDFTIEYQENTGR